jgi:2-dehydropantoate 2-reductase
MRVLVIGAGIIGAVYGWALSDCGHDVVHLVRHGRSAALLDGLPVDMLDLRKGHKRRVHGVYKLAATESVSPADGFELVIVPVKHYALAETLKEVVPAAGQADFLLLTQNWRGTAEIDPILPHARYVYGDAKAGGSFSAGTLVAALKAIDLGPPEGELSTLAAKVADPFRCAGIPTRLHSDMLHYLWVQYAITGGPWAALVQAGSFEALLSDRKAGPDALTAACECLEVVRQRGVDLAGYPEAKPFLGNAALSRQVLGWTMKWMFRHNEYVKRCSSHALGDPVEVATFYDDLIATGHDLGVAMPVMESYAGAIRRFAAAGGAGARTSGDNRQQPEPRDG